MSVVRCGFGGLAHASMAAAAETVGFMSLGLTNVAWIIGMSVWGGNRIPSPCEERADLERGPMETRDTLAT